MNLNKIVSSFIYLNHPSKKSIHRFKLKQEALFVEALNEIGIDVEYEKLIVNHEKPANYYDGIEYPLIFPLRYLRRTSELSKNKLYDFVFIGKKTDKREWIKTFEGANNFIQFTEKGREILKTHYDNDYYKIISESKFALCPKGDFDWTYRFYEAIMCFSIPIIDYNPSDKFIKKFNFYIFKNNLNSINYNLDFCRDNYLIFLNKHTFISKFIDKKCGLI